MADKLVALLGPGDGPRMFTGKMPNLVARVVNLTDGSVEVNHDQGTMLIETVGNHQLPESEFIQFCHKGKSKNLICTLLSKAHAVPSP